jgi:hypothetical protein
MLSEKVVTTFLSSNSSIERLNNTRILYAQLLTKSMRRCLYTSENILITKNIGICVIFSSYENSVNYDIPDDAIAISDRNENTYSYVEIDGVI